EEETHVEDRIDGDPRHADIAGDTRMIAVITAMGREIEGDGQPLLPGRQVAAVEGIGLFCRGKAGILPDRPRLLHIHGRVGAAQERGGTRPGVEEAKPGNFALAIEPPDLDLLRRAPDAGGRLGPRERWLL